MSEAEAVYLVQVAREQGYEAHCFVYKNYWYVVIRSERLTKH